MSATTIVIIGVTIMCSVSSFFFGALWGRESVLRVRRKYRSFDPDQF